MKEHGYFELSKWSGKTLGLNVMSMPGNMLLIRRHWQNGIEVLSPLKGDLTVKIEETKFHLSEGDVIAIDAGLSHEVTSSARDNVQLIFNIDNQYMRRVKGEHIWLSTVGTNAALKTESDITDLRLSIARLAEIAVDDMFNIKMIL